MSEEKYVPESYFDTELETALEFAEEGDPAMLAELGCEILLDTNEAVKRDTTAIYRGFGRKDGAASFMPDRPLEPYKLRFDPSVESQIRVIETQNHKIVKEPSCYIVKIPLEVNPVVLVGMSSCSCMYARSETELFVAHIGLSSTGMAELASGIFSKEELGSDQISVIANTGDFPHDYGVVRPDYDYRHATLETYIGLGISPDRIHTFKYRDKDSIDENMVGILLTSDTTAYFSFDLPKNATRKDKESVEVKKAVSLY